MDRSSATGRRERGLDDALAAAGREGFCLLDLPPGVAVSADPQIVRAVVDLVTRALHPSRRTDAVCERHPSGTRLVAHRVAVGVCRSDQRRAVRRELAARGLDDISVLATRHRHGCVIVGRQSDRKLLEGVPLAIIDDSR